MAEEIEGRAARAGGVYRQISYRSPSGRAVSDPRSVRLQCFACSWIIAIVDLGGGMNFNDLLAQHTIDPKAVLVLRHRPFEANLRRVILWLAGDQPEIFNAYQQTQGPQVEAAMQRSTHVASFIGHETGKAVFVGLFERHGTRRLTKPDYWAMPAYQALKDFGMHGWVDERESLLWFDLVLTDFYSDWIGKLVLNWPGGERSWWRWADRNTLRVQSIADDSLFEQAMPSWEAICLSISDLRVLPKSWRDALQHWRGIYFIFDRSDGKGYVGSAYGSDNLLGRWLSYVNTGHGGNAELRGRLPENFNFSILQRLSPDLEASEVIRIEGSWKDRLHTHEFGLNRN
jgi:hypothetical protein